MAKYHDSLIKRRIKYYCLYKNITIYRFQKSIGVSTAFVASIDQSIAPKTQDKIRLAFPDLNIGWLLTGEGEMLKEHPMPKPNYEANNAIKPLYEKEQHKQIAEEREPQEIIVFCPHCGNPIHIKVSK